MNECHQIRNQLLRTTTVNVPSNIREHCRHCPECAGLLAAHLELQQTGSAIPEPDPDALARMRQSVHQRVKIQRQRPSLLRDLTALLQAHPAFSAIVIVFVLSATFMVGRLSHPPIAFSTHALVQDLNHQAVTGTGLEASLDSPFVYSNVTFRARPDGQLDLSFDVTRHLQVITPPTSPLARQVVAHTILEPDPLGSRLKAMDMSVEISDSRIRDALITTLRHDPALPIRLKALEVLSRRTNDPQVRSALLRTLAQDTSVQIRLGALTALAEAGVSSDLLQKTILTANQDTDQAVWLQARSLIRP